MRAATLRGGPYGAKRRKFLRNMIIALLLPLLGLIGLFPSVSAEKRLIEADGYAIMGDGPEENPAVAQDRARKDAKRAASEKAGVYVESMSEVKKGLLTKDEVRTISANVLEVQSDPVTAEVLGGLVIRYHCHITVLVDTDIVTSQLNKGREKLDDRVRMGKDQEKYTAQNDKELATLKERYKKASEPERQEINQEVKRNEEKFTATQWNEKGIQNYTKGDYTAAIDCYKKAVETDSKYSAPWSGLGWVYQDQKEYDKAIESFQKAIDLYAEFAPSWNGLAYAYNYKGEYDKAIGYCQKAVELDATYAAPRNNLGYAYSKLGRYDEAIACYQKAIELDAKDGAPWANLGTVYDKLGDNDKAMECYRKSVELEDGDANAWNGLGYAHSKAGDFDQAIKSFERATELKPKYAAPWNGLGYAYNQKKKFDKAVRCFKKAVNIDPDYANAWNGLGYAYSGQGLYKKAFEAYGKAVEIDPDNETYKKNLETAKGRI